jgi:hypothetical protein
MLCIKKHYQNPTIDKLALLPLKNAQYAALNDRRIHAYRFVQKLTA